MSQFCRSAASFFLIAVFLLGSARASAQSNPLVELYPALEVNDINGVDLASGRMRFHDDLLTPSSADRLGVTLDLTSPGLEAGYPLCGASGAHGLGQNIYASLSTNSLLGTMGGIFGINLVSYKLSELFYPENLRIHQSDGTYLYPNFFTSGTLILNSSETEYTYTAHDGTVIKLSPQFKLKMAIGNHYTYALATNITYPDGEKWTYNYNTATYSVNGSCSEGGVSTISRIKSIVSNKGYAIQFNYENNSASLTTQLSKEQWYSITRITRYNKSKNFCNESLLLDCPGLTSVQYVDISYDRNSVALTISRFNADSKQIIFKQANQSNAIQISKITSGNIAETAKTYSYTEYRGDDYSADYVNSVASEGKTWSYEYTKSGGPGESSMESHIIATDPNGSVLNLSMNPNGMPYWKLDALGHQWNYTYVFVASDGIPRLSSVSQPEDFGSTTISKSQEFSYDSRGNRTQAKSIPKVGSGLTPIAWNAAYPATCVDRKICNKPMSITDPLGAVTSYTYDPVHGGILTATSPSIGGLSSVTRYAYTARRGWVSNGAGSYVQNAGDIYLLVSEKTCRTSATIGNTCSGGSSDEVSATYDYGPDSGPNNLWLRGKTVTADGISLRTCYGYDAQGNKISETSPRAGLTVCS